MQHLALDRDEKTAISKLLDEYEGELADLESDHVLQRATVLAHRLPERVRAAMNSFRLGNGPGVLSISGYEVDHDRLGPTPGHWRDRPQPSPAHREELLLILYGSLLGDPFAWATQQNGRLVHDVIPIAGHENEQLGSSSESLLTWHTEDAFHPARGDFLLFACLRNPYAAATTVGYVDGMDLSAQTTAVLFEERFGIRPDESHLAKNNTAGEQSLFEDIDEMNDDPVPVAVLFGDPAAPYIRADPYFMTVKEGDDEAREALDMLVKVIDERMFDVQLESGEYCFIDNHRVVHGRKPFKARHDGTDRWLKRINVTADLRKSRGARKSLTDRKIH
jgi:Fe(II)/alpha-ketoglutarate-dependent arginine beta-hydroxylase